MSAGWAAVIAAFITELFAVIGQSIISKSNNKALIKEIYAELDKKQAVTDTKMDELTREVREHNNFARRMPVLEEKIAQLERREANNND